MNRFIKAHREITKAFDAAKAAGLVTPVLAQQAVTVRCSFGEVFLNLGRADEARATANLNAQIEKYETMWLAHAAEKSAHRQPQLAEQR